jgi:hypothetical protein
MSGNWKIRRGKNYGATFAPIPCPRTKSNALTRLWKRCSQSFFICTSSSLHLSRRTRTRRAAGNPSVLPAPRSPRLPSRQRHTPRKRGSVLRFEWAFPFSLAVNADDRSIAALVCAPAGVTAPLERYLLPKTDRVLREAHEDDVAGSVERRYFFGEDHRPR